LAFYENAIISSVSVTRFLSRIGKNNFTRPPKWTIIFSVKIIVFKTIKNQNRLRINGHRRPLGVKIGHLPPALDKKYYGLLAQ